MFWLIFHSSFSYKSAKNENKINLAYRTEEACSMNIHSKNQLDSPNTFLVIVVTVQKKIVLRKTRLKLMFKASSSLKLYNSGSGLFFTKFFGNLFSIVHRFKKCKKKIRFFGKYKVEALLKESYHPPPPPPSSLKKRLFLRMFFRDY